MGFFDSLFKKAAPAPAPVPKPLDVTFEPGTVLAPCSGKVEPMDSLPDPLFATGAMGTCLGVWPENGTVYAPVSGTITAAMPHALGFLADDENEILIHVGVDTVNMAGDGFSLKVKQGDHVDAGQVVLVFDLDKVAKAGYKDVVMTFVTNSGDIEEAGGSVAPVAEGTVAAGDALLKVTK